MAKLSIKEKIATLKSQKSVADRVYDAIETFSDSEMDEVRKVLVRLFDLSAGEAVVDAPVVAKKASFAKPVVASADAPKRGRKPKNKVKEDVVAAEKPARGGRGRKGEYPTIHDTEIHDAIISILKDNNGELSQKEIRDFLFQGAYAAHKSNKSFQTRVSNLMGKWCKSGEIAKVQRGVYALVKR